MDTVLQRLDGWKTIAAHFRRDRTTVMRWAKVAGLPVHRVPGDSASVYAFVAELNDWLSSRGTRSPPPATLAPNAEKTEAAVDRAVDTKRLTVLAALSTILFVASVATLLVKPSVPHPSRVLLPRDPAIAQVYVQARDDWASRTPAGIRKAFAELAVVTRRDPRFAPGFAGLADTYLLAREFAGMPSSEAYAKAEAAARVALSIDPKSSDAARSMGFIDYYFHGDNLASRSRFAAALKSDPENAQTYLWYGNALSDNGQTGSGLQALERARLLDPGSRAIEADYDFALWKDGQGSEAKSRLHALVTTAPMASEPHNFLSIIAFADRDFPEYMAQAELGARLSANRARIAEVAAQRDAYRSGGARMLLQTVGRQWDGSDGWLDPPRRNATILAAMAGDRGRAVALLREADARSEIWRGTGWIDRAVGDLRVDPEASALLKRRQPPTMVADRGL